MKYISNSNWKSSIFCILPKIHKSKRIIEEINESHNILNMQPREDLKGRPNVGGPNSPTQSISGVLEKILAPIVSCLKTCFMFHVSCIPHDLGSEALSHKINRKQNLIPEHFTKVFVLEAVSFMFSNNNVQYNISFYS